MATYTTTFAERLRKKLRATGFGVAPAATTADGSVPLVTAGSGAASASDPNGSLRLRSDGAPEYRDGGAWKAVASGVAVAVTAAGGAGGATAGTLSLQANLLDESSATARAVQILVVVSDASGAGLADLNANVTFNTASSGTLVASGSGWALVETTAAGVFACATANSSDETVYVSATTPQGFTDPTDAALVISDIATATWAA